MHRYTEEMLLHVWHDTVPPDGWRSQIIGEGIVLTPPLDSDCSRIAAGIPEPFAFDLDTSGF
ncbi:MAG TPA: hypothetical protein VH352_11885 [Pseudonocardiaceae bacterium]|nr:hypothetical protein [Pseudonocardiaceae bacterium]